jgi:hypothetical protein
MMGNLRMNSTDKHLEPSARLQFLAGWQTVKHGSIRPGGQLIIDSETSFFGRSRPLSGSIQAANSTQAR